MKIKGFTLIELLVVTVIIGILSALGVPVFESQKSKATDGWSNAIVANASKILMADEFSDGGQVNFANLDGDGSFVGTDDPVTVADVRARLEAQDYILAADNRAVCFLYGYEASAGDHDDMIIVAKKQAQNGTGSAGFIFSGTDNAKKEAENITAIDCTPGSEGVTGGTWTDYQWLNLIP